MTYGSLSASNYLESLVLSAPPARLRLMLIEKAVGLCQLLSDRWTADRTTATWDAQSIQLSDVLTELLAGISRDEGDLTRQVADLYVFLLQHQNLAVANSDPSMMDEIRTVLEIEAETWRLVCAQTASTTSAATYTNRPVYTQHSVPTKNAVPAPAAGQPFVAGSFSLQG